ncbi:MAG: hypothetical protein ACPGJE_06315 [Wenzhouxiangellaceae bacterium]
MSNRRWQMAGLLLWRGGLLFVIAYGFYHGAWQIVRQLDWPPQITVGAALALAGFALVMLSLILERRQAARAEGSLLDE